MIKFRKEQLRQTSFLYRFVKEKVQRRKLKSLDLLQMREEFLRAQEEFQAANDDYIQVAQSLATLLGDKLQKVPRPSQTLFVRELNLPLTELLRLGEKSAPLILESLKNLKVSNRSFQKNQKDRLPLPRLGLKLGAYRQNYSNTGVSDTYLTDTSNRNIELKASLNMKWTLFGEKGWFNSRDAKRSYIDKRIAQINLKEAKRLVEAGVRALHKRITYNERKFAASEKRLKNAKNTFDKALDNFMSAKTNFAHIKFVIDSLNLSQNEFENIKYTHLVNKLSLSELIGADDLPGQSFENLTRR